MKSYIVTILSALLLQYAWAGPFSCVECPPETDILCPEGCAADETCTYIPRSCTSCQRYECQKINKPTVADINSQHLYTPGMVPCPHCEKCYNCENIPQFRANCPQVCMDIESNDNVIDGNMLMATGPPCPRCKKCYNCEDIPYFRDNCPQVCMDVDLNINEFDGKMLMSTEPSNFDILQQDEIEEAGPTEEIDVDSNYTEIKAIQCPSCENCVDCDENPEYLDVCPAVCIVKSELSEGCPTCIGCIDCTKHPKYLEDCPEVCKVEEEEDVNSIVCPACEGCIDCSGRPIFKEYCPSSCMVNENGEIIDNGGDENGELDGVILCPSCENCIDCEQHPEFLVDCPGVCFSDEDVTTELIGDDDEEFDMIEEPTITCPKCKHCVNCDEKPIYIDICPEVCMTESEIIANSDLNQKDESIVCPSCTECVDCSNHPEYIDSCPHVCKIDVEDTTTDTEEDEDKKVTKCPKCIECVDCSKHPEYLIDCPNVCRNVIVIDEEQNEMEQVNTAELDSTMPDEEAVDDPTADLESNNAANAPIACPKCIGCIDCDSFPDYLIHCPSVCQTTKPYIKDIDEEENMGAENEDMFNTNIEVNDGEINEISGEMPVEEEDTIITQDIIGEETVACPRCIGCINCDDFPDYLESCPEVCIPDENKEVINEDGIEDDDDNEDLEENENINDIDNDDDDDIIIDDDDDIIIGDDDDTIIGEDDVGKENVIVDDEGGEIVEAYAETADDVVEENNFTEEKDDDADEIEVNEKEIDDNEVVGSDKLIAPTETIAKAKGEMEDNEDEEDNIVTSFTETLDKATIEDNEDEEDNIVTSFTETLDKATIEEDEDEDENVEGVQEDENDEADDDDDDEDVNVEAKDDEDENVEADDDDEEDVNVEAKDDEDENVEADDDEEDVNVEADDDDEEDVNVEAKDDEDVNVEANEDEAEVQEDVTEAAKEEIEDQIICLDCENCIDCTKNEEFYDACPSVCKKRENVVCPMCIGCKDCSKSKQMMIDCPSACSRV